ncbi:MAG: lytic transglycosylase domain-containing protein [Bacteriovoracaceae bacterium]|nr:lytic transglycosylase domain-containing protein [Bacteriovoracaceae bacterium]
MDDQFRSAPITFILLLFLSFSSFASTPSKSPSKLQITKLLNDPTLKVTRAETRLGHNLAKLFEITEQGYINIRLTKKLLKQVNTHPTFYIYKDWLKAIVDIHSNKSVKAMRSTCSKMSLNQPSNHLKSDLQAQATSMCFNQYLKLLAKKKDSLNAHKSEFEFFEAHAESITNKSVIEGLSFLLSRFKESDTTLTRYSKILADHFMSKSRTPPKSLLQYMEITPDLTRFIQVKGLDQYSSKYVLFSELKKLIKKAFNAADKEKKEKEIAKHLREALNYYRLSYEHLPQAKADKRVLSLGKSLTRRSHFKIAREAFETILKLNPKDENTTFELMWTWITQEEYKKAFSQVIVPYNLHNGYASLSDERLQFWVAYTMKEAEIAKHKEIFENLVTKSPLNYYSILAAKLLSEEFNSPADKLYYRLANKDSTTPKVLPKLDTYSIRSLKRLKIWGDLDFKPFIKLEYNNIFKIYSRVVARQNESHSLDESQATMVLLSSAALKEEENYLESFKIIYRGLNRKLISLDENVLNILFPRPFLNQVSKYSKNYDPLIALSLIRQESGFNSRARSWVGARGLMQLMPATAKMYWNGVQTKHLYNPNINIKIGSKYLTKLMNQYESNLVYALSAYNAGESRVKKWRREYLTHEDSILHNIENIPFPETRKYVKLIFRNLFFYKMMDKELELADSKKVNKIFDVYLGFNAK